MADASLRSRIVVAGHICLDVIPSLPTSQLPKPGHLLKIGPATLSTGGAVANTGLALHRLGTPVSLMGKVGADPFGQTLLAVLRAHNPSLAADMIVSPGEATSYSIVISPPGVDRSFMHCPGANDTFTAADVPSDRLANARLLHFGYPPVMRQMYADGGGELVRLFQRVRGLGVATSLDMTQPDPASEAGQLDWHAVLKRILPLIDVFLPSIEELLFMLDRPAFDRLSHGEPWAAVITGPLLRRLGQQLLAMGTAVAVIKLGERGLYVCTSFDAERIEAFASRVGIDATAWRDREIWSPCFVAKEVVGTTGSGDCTIAGFLAALLRGETPTEAATSATAVGACSVEAADATGGVPAWAIVRERLQAGWKRLDADLAWGPEIDLHPNAIGTVEIQSKGKRI